ncbi:MAG TPA: hypothetical protein VFC78_07465 [Tepidisphaeraceae bacterium]|nr:hypothetical protein [Tepidisphaeraceae bacterium]
MIQRSQGEHILPLPGIDGGNLLAFLAAIGTFRTLADILCLPVRMSWSPERGALRPALHMPAAEDAAQVIELLTAALEPSRVRADGHPCMNWKYWEGESECRRQLFDNARISADRHGRAMCDWLSAIGADLVLGEKETSDTPLRASRADYLVGNLKTIIGATSDPHLKQALFAPWTYDDPLDNCSLKFDPSEDRRHALQWSAPTKDRDRKKRGNMLGANRLAIEALPLFTSTIQGKRLATTACSRVAGEWRVTWPLWSEPASLDVVRSLLSLADLSDDSRNPSEMREMGLCAVFRCHRQTIGKTRVFTPATRIA